MKPLRRPAGRRPFKGAAHANPSGAPADLRAPTAAMRRYLEHLGLIGATEQSLHNAERYICDFIDWADERGVTHPSQVTRSVLERYQRWLYHYRKKNGEPLSLGSQRCKVVPLRGWFKWLTRSGEIPANPAADIDLPRMVQRLPRYVLTASEVEQVMTLADTTTPLGLRDRAMLEVFYSTGMRRTELARLETGDIDAERGVVLIRQGKGRKDRLIPIGARAVHWVGQYQDQARPQLAWNAADATLFLGIEGRPLNPNWMSSAIGQYIERAEIGKHGSCHLLRHTMATLMLEGGADIRFIQAMLGHADLSTTQIYTQVSIRQLQKVHAMTHPGARRRVRGGLNDVDMPSPRLDAADGPDKLLAVLDAEAEREAIDDDDDSDDAACT